MEHLEYQIVISAPARKVWDAMLQKQTYEQWVEKSWPGSSYQGKWEKGEQIRFIGKDGSGTLAEIVELQPYQKVVARHIAALGPGGTEDRTSDIASGWIGTMEGYEFDERGGETTVTVSIDTTPEWKQMFDDGWPVALEELKQLTEHQVARV